MGNCAEVGLVEPGEQSSDTYTDVFATGFSGGFFKFFSGITMIF